MSSQYVPLHRHTSYSHDGFNSPLEAAQYAKLLGLPGLAVTEHGNMFSAVKHYWACQELGLLSPLGCEVYMQPTDEVDKEGKRYHLTVLAANNTGLRNLYAMLSEASDVCNFHYVPIVSMSNLFRHSDGVIVLSGCISSYLSSLLIDGLEDDALNFARVMKRQFGNNFYLEVQPFSTAKQVETTPIGDFEDDAVDPLALPPEAELATVKAVDGQRVVNLGLIDISSQLGIALVMTGDDHFAREADYAAFQASHQLRKKTGLLADYRNRYMMDRAAMEVHWDLFMGDVSGAYAIGSTALDNTVKIAQQCANVTLPTGMNMPELTWVEGDHFNVLMALVKKGMKEKGVWKNEAWRQRVEDELTEIVKYNYVDYFLAVWDVLHFCKAHDILVHLRGSGCACAVLNVLGGHMVDPIALQLPFERFLGEGRFPDADIDVQDNRRDEVQHYLQTRYPGAAFPITTFNTWGTRGLVNGLKSVYGMDAKDAAMLLASLTSLDLDGRVFSADDLLHDATLRFLNDKYVGIVEVFARIHGGVNYVGRHAAGYALVNGDHCDKFPLVRVGGKEGQLQAGYDMKDLDKLGVAKIDVLGVSYLSSVTWAMKDAGVSYSPEWLEDEEVYAHLAKGEALTVFQLDNARLRPMLKRLRPSKFTDIMLINALNRPSVLHLADSIIEAKGRGKPINKFWSHLLPDSYGAIVYQEDTMLIARELAGMSNADIQKLLKAIKRGDTSTDLGATFIQGLMDRRVCTDTEAADLWAYMQLYGFNKPHAAAYAMWAVIGAYLLLHYPYSWYTGVLRYEGKQENRQKYVAAAYKAGCHIATPHVNWGAFYSHSWGCLHPVPTEENLLATSERFPKGVKHIEFIQEGLTNIPGIGEAIALAIQEEARVNGPFTSDEDFRARMPIRTVNKRAYELLQTYGALCFDVELRGMQILHYWNNALDKR